jgi:FeS assembly protein IscX
MNRFSQSGKLYWDSTYEIVLALIEQYPGSDIDAVGLDELNEYIVTLPNFADDPRLANEGILSEILWEWYEEVNP